MIFNIMRKSSLKLFIILGISIHLSFSAVLGAPSADVYPLKAALVYNFAKFTVWPESVVKKTVDICYFNELYTSSMERLSGKKISQYFVSIKQIENIDDVDQCHLVYIDKSKREILNRLFIKVKDKPILTVSDISGFYDEGGMIEIKVTDNRLRFLINLAPVNKSNIVLSSQMLKLAVEVKR
ncbi:YfiR family protein [Neptunomonas japonica]|nr:YfiR family protein [Neptunomonas japonica]